MIELTRLNGKPIVLNSDLIKSAEASPDTMLTLINGEKLIVREDLAEVVERVLAYRARLLANVARRLPTFGDIQQVVAFASLPQRLSRAVLAFRARLLANVARRLPTFGDIQQVVAFASLEVSGQPGPMPVPPRRSPDF